MREEGFQLILKVRHSIKNVLSRPRFCNLPEGSFGELSEGPPDEAGDQLVGYCDVSRANFQNTYLLHAESHCVHAESLREEHEDGVPLEGQLHLRVRQGAPATRLVVYHAHRRVRQFSCWATCANVSVARLNWPLTSS